MDIRLLVEEVLRTGWLKLTQESAVLRRLGGAEPFSARELGALVRLQKALRAGEVLVGERKRCVNAMEEPVREAIARQVAARELEDEEQIDLGDVAAYALNRLRPLYATTHQGYRELLDQLTDADHAEIDARVGEALDRILATPRSRPDGSPLEFESGRTTVDRAVAHGEDP